MSEDPISSIAAHFGELEDPRIEWCKEHELLDIIVIAICAVICGAKGWTDFEEFGRTKQAWLKQFLELSHGIPSHDTFVRVFSRWNAEAFQHSLLAWVKAAQVVRQGQVIAVNWKELHRSLDVATIYTALDRLAEPAFHKRNGSFVTRKWLSGIRHSCISQRMEMPHISIYLNPDIRTYRGITHRV